ncbi:DUF7124 domain-containing protein [Halodesulfurarchaeum formicicum]|nr:hypothetical protein [Halodesulfurarchaeum formicicum]
MNADPHGGDGADEARLRTDGGSKMPGVPSGEEESQPEPDSTSTSSSGAQMPGVPDSKGPEPAAKANEGNTCGAPTEDAEDDVTHGLTTAFTLNALASTADPAAVVDDARNWSDWVGVVGTVDSPTMNTFLRRNGVDIDFFNGANGPAERLARVAQSGSTFHSDRLVLVGVPGEEGFAPEDGWEFEPLEPTAEEAGWELK